MKRIALAISSLCLLTGTGQAHPHVWATMRTAMIADALGPIKAVGIEWTFDETYTQFALEGLDANGDGTFDDAEIKPLTDENIKSLEESQYFTYVRQNGAVLPIGKVTEYGQSLKDGKLTLYFVVPLVTAADPKTAPVELQVYDPDFFIAFDYVPDSPVKLTGTLADGCAMALKPLQTEAEMDSTRAMLADKPQDWTPDQPTDFGAMFAQSLIAKCG